MIGKSTIVWVCLATVASGILYHTSYRVQEQAERLSSINRQIVAEQEAIQVLKAEWAYLNDPARLERLVAQHTALKPVQVAQMVTLDAIPEKLPEGVLVAEAPAAAAPAPRTQVAAAAPTKTDAAKVAAKPAPKKTDAPKAGGAKPAPQAAPVDGPVLLARYGARR
ncbi:MAG TPA: hypothetical protein VED40_13300 [Azospirillaceae bacterium]|nr:hypothetical protein [Azospirillaceae bacterium]